MASVEDVRIRMDRHLSLERIFFLFFKVWIRGFQDLLRVTHSSLFTLLAWISIAVTSLIIRSLRRIYWPGYWC